MAWALTHEPERHRVRRQRCPRCPHGVPLHSASMPGPVIWPLWRARRAYAKGWMRCGRPVAVRPRKRRPGRRDAARARASDHSAHVEGHSAIPDDARSDWIVEALAAVADEVSEASAEHYEAGPAVEDGVLRIWFGVVPAKSPPRGWRELVAELAPIELAEIRRRTARACSRS